MTVGLKENGAVAANAAQLGKCCRRSLDTPMGLQILGCFGRREIRVFDFGLHLHAPPGKFPRFTGILVELTRMDECVFYGNQFSFRLETRTRHTSLIWLSLSVTEASSATALINFN